MRQTASDWTTRRRSSRAKGISCGGAITILPGVEAGEEFAVLVHEYAHEKLHRGARRAATTRTIRETEAEAVAYVVSQAIGLDAGTASADYIQLYDGDKETLAESLMLIQRTGAEIIGAVAGG